MGEDFQISPAAEKIVKHRRLENGSHLLQRLLTKARDVVAANFDFTRRWPDLTEHHANGCAFSRAIVAKQSKNFTAWHLQIQIFHRNLFGEFFLNLVKLNHVI